MSVLRPITQQFSRGFFISSMLHNLILWRKSASFYIHNGGTSRVAFGLSNQSGVKAGIFSFLPNEQASPGADTFKLALTKANPEVAMAQNDFNIPLGANFAHLSEVELSALLDLLTSQIEYHRDELTRLKPILHRLQAKIPNNPIRDFINSLD